MCRDPRRRALVCRRPEQMSRCPGHHDWLIGGAVEVGESCEEAAAREPAEELGVRARVRFALHVLLPGAISPYWLGVHEAVVTERLAPDPSEIARHGRLGEPELREAMRKRLFVPDGLHALRRHPGLGPWAAVTP
ncbi:NUDIX domain-containing protein [Streptomyces luteogriseus]|uniref:NUDIX domain-containing protein n=1 Tax=Streptomyces luteogriseus TaxID=68233 RepID=UPI0036EB1F36